MKKLFIINIILLLLLIFVGCKKNSPTEPQPTKPPGYQEDIPWASLADSPWPMNHHDPQSTGRSKFVGPSLGVFDWTLDSIYMKSGVSIASDGTIYFISTSERRGLFALNPDGSIKWVLKEVVDNSDLVSTPLLGNDGTIYIGGGLNGKLYAINPDGTIKWELETLGFIYNVGLNIGIDGTIYLLNGGPTTTAKLVAVNPIGKIDWYYENDNIYYATSSGTAISPDGKTIYIPGTDPSLFAFDLVNRKLKWEFGNTRYGTSPTVDNEGNIYLVTSSDTINSGNTSVFCLTKYGQLKWSYNFGWNADLFHFILEGTIDENGDYYFAIDTLYSFDYSGNLKRKVGLGGTSLGSLINDKNGNIYLNLGSEQKYLSINNDGIIRWSIDLSNQFSGHSPALSSDGKLYIPTFKSNRFYCIK
ncbi:MAG: PQQ-binding-like beta-propeller repeat protein [Ignavibacteriaceae bacterium]|nr:PQQ-binding-like beta-propeller repeat protein [Ignavibacteriaceae bacterium]